jgi:hypothetical protein
MRVLTTAAMLLAAGCWIGGCVKPAEPDAAAKKDGEHDHDHEHGHEHVHHGPHQGPLMVIGEEEYHAEWTRDEATGKVTFYILDKSGKNEVPIEAEAITIDVKIGDNPPRKFELVAVNPKDGKTPAFEIVDKEFEALFGQLKSSGVVLTLHVDIGGKHFSEQVKEHDHGH